MRMIPAAGLAALLALASCKSAFIEADVNNANSAPVSLVEVDYPSASFGVESLAAGATYHYRFKVLGGGATKVMWTDVNHHDHTVAGPELHEGQSGTLIVVLQDSTATWRTHLQP